jgi:hypothetical protein
MSSDSGSEVKLEIGHVLFIDIVGYSQLLIIQQSEQIETLRRIVRGTAQFRAAEAEGKLLRLPTGDGGALVFRPTPEAPVLCALELAKELKEHPELRVRMGVHSGPVHEVTDLNERANIAGAERAIVLNPIDAFTIAFMGILLPTLASGNAAAPLRAVRWNLIPVTQVGIASLNSRMPTERRTIAERSR